MQDENRGAPPASVGTDKRAFWTTVAVFALIAVAYLATVSPAWYVHPDSAKYLALARSLSRGEGYVFNHVPHGKYVPVFPLLLAPVWAVLGRHFVVMQTLVALTGIGALAGTYA